jgi:transglutaminase-like putative cysteine protease
VSQPEFLISAAAMTVFSVHHKTTYRYKRPIKLGLHQLLFRPRDSFDQRLMDCRIEVVPEPAEVRWIHDVFGNCLTLVDFGEKCEFLEFETFIRLEHTPENAPDFRIEDYARSHPFSYSDDESPDLGPYMRRHHPQDVEVAENVLEEGH